MVVWLVFGLGNALGGVEAVGVDIASDEGATAMGAVLKLSLKELGGVEGGGVDAADEDAGEAGF